MKFWIIVALLTLILSPAAIAQEQDTPKRPTLPSTETPDAKADDYEAILAWLSHYHEVPGRAQLEAVSPRARQILFDIAQDEDAFLMHRHRALYALGTWADQEVYAYLTNLLVNESTEDGLRHHLLPILAQNFGEKALDALAPFLQHDDPQIRISAAGAIAHIPGDAPKATLRSAMKDETHPMVQGQLERFTTEIR